jgi:hypothetical protein
MAGRATFYGAGPEPRGAEDYRMWRVYNPDRTSSHGADGLVRIRAISGGKRLFEVGYDGTTTWNDKGIVPQAEADAYWASAFGFGIIRQASRPGFVLSRVPDDQFAGHPIYKLRLVDPKGGETLFGIDKTSHAIRTMEFATPKGWHLRTYDDFVMLENPRWLQARTVTLYYNGVKQNEGVLDRREGQRADRANDVLTATGWRAETFVQAGTRPRSSAKAPRSAAGPAASSAPAATSAGDQNSVGASSSSIAQAGNIRRATSSLTSSATSRWRSSTRIRA